MLNHSGIREAERSETREAERKERASTQIMQWWEVQRR